MSRTHQQKQKEFRKKLQAEGADAFADGPRPWEQWDESGNQGNDRIWEGSARRIYPKQQYRRSIGDRLLSGLAVVALASLMVGIAGVYLSTISTPQLASTAIHPAPIVTDRQMSAKADPAAVTTSSLAKLETLSPPAADSSTIQPAPIATDRQATTEADSAVNPTAALATLQTPSPPAADRFAIQPAPIDSDRQATTEADSAVNPTAALATLEPPSPAVTDGSTTQPAPIATDRQATTEADTAANPSASLASLETLSPPAAGASATPGLNTISREQPEPALQPVPVAPTAHIDRVAVETVITEATVTTTVYTQQPSLERPELVATIKTTPPHITPGGAAEKQDFDATSAQQNASTDAVEQAAEAVVIAEAQIVAAEPVVDEPPAIQITTAVVDEQASSAVQTGASAAQSELPLEKTDTARTPTNIDMNSSPATAVVDEQASSTVHTEASDAQSELPLEKTDAAETPTNIDMNSSPATVEATPDITSEKETTTETPAMPDAKTGLWVINIASYTRKSTAERMLAVFKEKGIDAEIFTTIINDKPMHRIRIAGFQSSRSARAGIPAIEQALGLDDVWVSRR